MLYDRCISDMSSKRFLKLTGAMLFLTLYMLLIDSTFRKLIDVVFDKERNHVIVSTCLDLVTVFDAIVTLRQGKLRAVTKHHTSVTLQRLFHFFFQLLTWANNTGKSA